MNLVPALVGSLLLALAGNPCVAHADNDDTTLLRVRLDRALERIESDTRTRRLVGGSILLAGGVGFGIGAYFASRSDDPNVRSNDTLAFGIAGGVFGVLGAGILIFPSEGETLPQAYRAMPDGTPAQLKVKMATGEDYLWQLASDARRERIMGGVVLVAIGAGEIVWYAANPSAFNNDSSMLYVGILTAGIGAANFLIRREAEDEYDNFVHWRDKPKAGIFTDVHWALVPTPGGAAGSLSLNF